MNGHGACIPFCMHIVFPFVIELSFRKEIIHSRENTQLLLALITGVTDSFPTYFIGIFVFFYVFWECL